MATKKIVPSRVNCCLHSNLTFTTARFQQYSLTVLVVAVLFACCYQDTQKHPFPLVLRNGTSFPLNETKIFSKCQYWLCSNSSGTLSLCSSSCPIPVGMNVHKRCQMRYHRPDGGFVLLQLGAAVPADGLSYKDSSHCMKEE